jgi:hypothetical protein
MRIQPAWCGISHSSVRQPTGPKTVRVRNQVTPVIFSSDEAVTDASSQSNSPDGMSEERAFMENLVNTRANFLLVIFSLVGTAVATSGSTKLRFAVFSSNFLIALPVAIATARAQLKLDIIFTKLKESNDRSSPSIEIDKCASEKAQEMTPLCRLLVGTSRRWMIGYLLPFLVCLLLFLGSCFTLGGLVHSIFYKTTSQLLYRLSQTAVTDYIVNWTTATLSLIGVCFFVFSPTPNKHSTRNLLTGLILPILLFLNISFGAFLAGMFLLRG